MEPKILLITVYPGGYGKALAEAALKRGDGVIAVTQDIAALDYLSAQYKEAFFLIPLNLTDRKTAFDGIDSALKIFGQIDAVIDAGFNIIDQEEKASGQQLKGLLENELLGVPWLSQAIFPVLQRQHNGHFIQVSSTSRIILPVLGHFQGPKQGQKSNLEKVAEEIQNQGIRVSFVEPFTDDHFVSDHDTSYYAGEVQASTHTISYNRFRIRNGHPSAVAEMLLGIIDSE
ncbi:SDR family NAD(P)-dependent oxidoreductase [Mucilaginibacter sp. BJC16-A38]|uniref:SDR family NAD(P)-dependent oxidoreductase n=1 Tax=Mucilaginibacter phenanthrenivorans TaxID=1234842 RepID=UPI002158075B|nr:SDR family NAD(P)-dependent oxidoreductase [Mucilaginibacter phenanthrenivorans]MCR8557351.1 SDR family NAD(P)-dependent oxidoreductase [Mucilaginibacter phenanthrenivorans]